MEAFSSFKLGDAFPDGDPNYYNFHQVEFLKCKLTILKDRSDNFLEIVLDGDLYCNSISSNFSLVFSIVFEL